MHTIWRVFHYLKFYPWNIGANLLLNIGPQPDGQLPETALSRLHELGLWMDTYGTTLYNTTAGPVPPCDWGATTQNDTNIYVHITQGNTPTITTPLDRRPRSVTKFVGGGKLRYTFNKKGGLTITLPKKLETPDHVIVIKK